MSQLGGMGLKHLETILYPALVWGYMQVQYESEKVSEAAKKEFRTERKQQGGEPKCYLLLDSGVRCRLFNSIIQQALIAPRPQVTEAKGVRDPGVSVAALKLYINANHKKPSE